MALRQEVSHEMVLGNDPQNYPQFNLNEYFDGEERVSDISPQEDFINQRFAMMLANDPKYKAKYSEIIHINKQLGDTKKMARTIDFDKRMNSFKIGSYLALTLAGQSLQFIQYKRFWMPLAKILQDNVGNQKMIAINQKISNALSSAYQVGSSAVISGFALMCVTVLAQLGTQFLFLNSQLRSGKINEYQYNEEKMKIGQQALFSGGTGLFVGALTASVGSLFLQEDLVPLLFSAGQLLGGSITQYWMGKKLQKEKMQAILENEKQISYSYKILLDILDISYDHTDEEIKDRRNNLLKMFNFQKCSAKTIEFNKLKYTRVVLAYELIMFYRATHSE
ncbi:hypothetical protein FGO68_gene17574 [Halteria grandinella]|uniref:Transmembrane protein n=1 Tax=Halteria grandinella TaxID=5974 RepID=A0A8J8T041_HALGN|nr:hypothetical protein FGO68_gene17574 [Halteria grandinella]